MKQLTFTQKLTRQRRFISFFIPLLALFLGLGTSQKAQAQGYNDTRLNIVTRIRPAAAVNTAYAGQAPDLPQPPANPLFNGADLGMGGSFLQSRDRVELTSSIIRLNTPASRPFIAARLEYRVYPTGSSVATIPAFEVLVLNQASERTTGGNVPYSIAGAGIDLLNQPSVLGGGNYTVEVRFVSTYSTPSGPVEIFNPGSSNNFRATFQVTAPPVTPTGGTTTWLGNAGSTNWNLASNWSNGVPTRTSNAIIPERVPSVPIVYPILDNSGVYEVNNLTLVGQSNSSRGEVTVERASLVVYGNLRQNAGGLRGTVTQAPGVRNGALNSTLILAGGNQVVTGRLGMSDVIIAGDGIKSVTGILSPSNTMSFQPANIANGVIVQSAFEDPGSAGTITPIFDTTLQTLIDLGSTGLINQEAGYAETNTSYVRGVLRSDRPVSPAIQIFGNVGLDVTANYTSVVNIIIFRIVGDPLQSPTSPNGIIAVPVKRQYLVDNALDSENPSFASATLSFVFHYLDSADELNGISEDNLTMFRSRSNGPPYAPVFGTPNTVNNTVTRAGLSSLSRFTLTLGDRQNPLPVRLTAFDAKRIGNDALVTWQTATEENSKGYEVQASTNGKDFRTLASVPSANPNSMKLTSYSYLDTEKNKSGLRYYRLRQIDIDGKDAFFAPRTVSFDGKLASASNLVAYPNPFNSNDELHLAVQSTAGKGQLSVTDLTGRTIRQQSVEMVSGLTDLTVAGMKDLKTGIYMVRLTLPTGEVKNMKVVKQ